MSSTQELTQANDTNVKQYESWDDLELNEDVTRGIYAYGFENPTPIQGRAIKQLIAGLDLIGQAQ